MNVSRLTGRAETRECPAEDVIESRGSQTSEHIGAIDVFYELDGASEQQVAHCIGDVLMRVKGAAHKGSLSLIQGEVKA